MYGGQDEIISGGLKKTWDEIASYNGETLPGEWISDRDVYAPGTTPTIGAQVVYKLAEPVEYQLSPNVITTVKGINNIWASCGSISSVVYSADTKTYVDDAIPAVPVTDVQVNGVSVLNNGVANVPIGTTTRYGVVSPSTSYGLQSYGSGSSQRIGVLPANDAETNRGIEVYRPIAPARQHASAFFGLAKAAGADMGSMSSTTVGVYPVAQKSAIHTMLNGSVSVTGTTPAITALPGIRYVCGEVATLTVNLPASGIIDVVFESGSTATVLTINPASGQTVRWTNGFDPTSLDANTVYEINVADGLGVAVGWT